MSKFRQQAEDHSPIDLKHLVYDERKEKDAIVQSTRCKETDKKHGMVREIFPNQMYIESQYLDGRKNGFCREIYDDGSYIESFFSKDREVGEWLTCDKN